MRLNFKVLVSLAVLAVFLFLTGCNYEPTKLEDATNKDIADFKKWEAKQDKKKWENEKPYKK